MKKTVPRPADLTEFVLNKDGRFIYPGNLVHYYKKTWEHFVPANVEEAKIIYHGISHTNHVFSEFGDGALWAYEEDLLGPEDIRIGASSALVHDTNRLHEKGLRDRVQIGRACDFYDSIMLDEDRPHAPRVHKTIWATLFELPRQPLVNPTIIEQLLYDIDLTQVFNSFYMELTYIGLARELGVTPLEMVRRQEGFIRSIKFHTEWAKKKFEPLMEPKIAHVHRLLDILS